MAPTDPADVLKDVVAAATGALDSAYEANRTRMGPALAVLQPADAIWCSGIGKSGIVARKIAGTMASLGRRAQFVHPVEALHGDGGAMRPNDALIVVSQSGHTAEILRFVREAGLPSVALARPGTPLDSVARATLDTTVACEAGGRLPVTAFTVAAALGDALALALGGEVRHPAGFIGAMALPVRRFMVPPPLVSPETRLLDLLPLLGLGAVLVEGGGIFTDGDLRRAVAADTTALQRSVSAFCTRSPVTVGADEPASVALQRMERRDSQIAVLPVVDGDRYVGLVRLHDLVRAGFGL